MLKKPEGLPIGIGQTKLAEKAETLPAVEVANTVVWVNPDMELPFKIEVGKPTNLTNFLPPILNKEKKFEN